MDYEIEISPVSLNDLRKIKECISHQLGQPVIAQQQIYRILKEIASLSYLPQRYGLLSGCESELGEVRIRRVDNYLILYRVLKEQRKVRVVSIVYYRRNIDGIFRNET